MEHTKKELEVGDIIWKLYRGDPISRMIIDRTTKTQAVTGATKYKINCEHGIRTINNEWNIYHYEFEDSKILERHKRKRILKFIKDEGLFKLDTEILETIKAAIKKAKGE